MIALIWIFKIFLVIVLISYFVVVSKIIKGLEPHVRTARVKKQLKLVKISMVIWFTIISLFILFSNL